MCFLSAEIISWFLLSTFLLALCFPRLILPDFTDARSFDSATNLPRDDDLVALDAEFFKQQKAEEERIQREKEDAELAKSLHSAEYQSVNRTTATTSVPSAFDRLNGIRPQPASSSSHMLSPARSQLGRTSSTTSSLSYSNTVNLVNPEQCSLSTGVAGVSSGSSASISRLKTESLSRPMHGAIQNSSDSDDSDIEIISASEFKCNGRSPSTRPPTRPNTEQSSVNSALRLATYEPKGAPEWMNGQWVSRGSTPASASSSSHTYNLSNYNSAELRKASLPGLANYTSSHHSIGSRPYGANIFTTSTNGIGTGYRGYTGYAGDSGYNIQTPGSGMTNGLHYMDNRLCDNMNLFGASGTVTNGSFMKPPSLSTDFDDGIYRSFDDAFNNRMADQLDYIINDPRKTNDEIKALIENIRPDEDLPAENREGTPEGLKYPLVGLHVIFYIL